MKHPLKIGIDGRLMYETGVGRYIRNLIAHLSDMHTPHTFVVFVGEDAFPKFTPPSDNWNVVRADVRWHTLAEQVVMAKLFADHRLNVVHVPYFNAPLFYPGPVVLTIHDLTILHVNTGSASTLPWYAYQMRRGGYHMVLTGGLRRAQRVIAVSESTRSDVVSHFPFVRDKIDVTYEGVEPVFRTAKRTKASRFAFPYALYVGNAYPHKNLDTLIESFLQFQKRQSRLHLVLVGKIDMFYRQLRQKVTGLDGGDRIVFYGAAQDDELLNLYDHASALVFPSQYEGFGLPALEALARQCPVVVSDIPVFAEILPKWCPRVPVNDRGAWAHAFADISRGNIPVKSLPETFWDTFSWSHMAEQTMEIYERSARI